MRGKGKFTGQLFDKLSAFTWRDVTTYLADEQDQFYRNLSVHEEKHNLFPCIDQQSL